LVIKPIAIKLWLRPKLYYNINPTAANGYSTIAFSLNDYRKMNNNFYSNE